MPSGTNIDAAISASISAANQSVNLLIPDGHSNWIAQVSGTFQGILVSELSANGSDYVPVNSRQSLLGRLGNTILTPGMFRGSACGATRIRLVATAWTSGIANITLRTSAGAGVVFQNSLVEVRDLAQYYSAPAGGNVCFAATTGAQTIPNAGGWAGVIQNPSDSGVDLYFERITVGANRAGRFERYRNPTVSVTGAATASVNRGGGTNTSKGKLYTAAAASASGGVLERVIFNFASGTDTTHEHGGVILRPGSAMGWWYIPESAGATLATVQAVYWEQSAAAT